MSQIQKLGPDSGGSVGDVVGPASSTDNAIVRWDGTTGKLIQDSGTLLDDNDNIFFVAGNVYNRTATAIDYNVLNTDYYIGVTDTSIARTVSLPAAPLGEGQVFLVKDESGAAGTNAITINVAGAATTIDGAASISLNSNYEAAYIFYDGAVYRLISKEFGDVVGPSTSTDNALVRWDSTTGKLIQDSGTLLDDNDNIFFVAGNVYNRTATAIDYTVLNTDYYVGVTDTSVARTVSLPAAPLGAGQVFLIKDESGAAGTNAITINVAGAATTIDGAASISLNSNYEGVHIVYNGTEFGVINRLITLAATDSTDNVAAGIRVVSAGMTKTVEITNRYRGTVQTTDATPTNIITIPLGATAGVYTFDVGVAAFNTTDTLGSGYNLIGSVRTDGTNSTLCGTPAKIATKEAGMTDADSNMISGGVGDNNLYIRATGIAAKTIEWNALARFTFVSA